MANRPIVYDEEQTRTFDVLWGWRDALIALAQMEQDLTGSTIGQLAGLAATPTGPASLTINIGAGRVYQQAQVDSTTYGSLASDTDVVQQQGSAAAQQIVLTTAALSAGQSQWALVQCQFAQVDQVAVGDPTAGLLLYFNSTNPSQPFQGPGNDGQIQNTTRLGTASVQVIYGSPATTGSEVPPNPTTGWLPMYLIDLTFGQTTITGGNILVAGPSVGTGVPSNYPSAPFIAGLLNAHHAGTAGQAPQIDLTKEVQHVLPLANTTASNTSGGGLPVMKLHAGNPNGNVAGNASVNGASDLCFDTTNLILYICTTTGSTSTAVWTSVVGSSTSQFAGGTSTGSANAQVVASTTPAGFAKTPGQVVTFIAGFTNTGSTTLNVDATGISTIQKVSGGSNVNLTGGEIVAAAFISVIWTGTVYLLQSGSLGALATLNIGQWLKNDGSGNLTIKNGANLGDDGSGNFVVVAGFLPPVGSVLPYAGSTAPTGFILAQGQAVSRTGATAALFAVCGITFGSGDGITTFNVPDLRGRVVAGVDGGANRLTTATMSSQALGGTGGLEQVSLVTANLPPYTPAGTVAGNAIAQSGSSGSGFSSGGAFPNLVGATETFTGSPQGGSSSPHLNVQPTLELSYIIKT